MICSNSMFISIRDSLDTGLFVSIHHKEAATTEMTTKIDCHQGCIYSSQQLEIFPLLPIFNLKSFLKRNTINQAVLFSSLKILSFSQQIRIYLKQYLVKEISVFEDLLRCKL